MTKEYNKMSIKEKEYANRQHGLPERCHECDVAVSPEDMKVHIQERCEGRAAPHPNARWIVHWQAIAMGVSKKELSELVSANIIRTKLKGAVKCYLMRDIAKFINAKAARARITDAKATAKATANALTESKKKDHKKPMSKKSKSLSVRIDEFAKLVGGFRPAGRELGIPVDTLTRAAKGKKINSCTRIAIEGSLDRVGA